LGNHVFELAPADGGLDHAPLHLGGSPHNTDGRRHAIGRPAEGAAEGDEGRAVAAVRKDYA
jgi:hypothetical protein